MMKVQQFLSKNWKFLVFIGVAFLLMRIVGGGIKNFFEGISKLFGGLGKVAEGAGDLATGVGNVIGGQGNQASIDLAKGGKDCYDIWVANAKKTNLVAGSMDIADATRLARINNSYAGFWDSFWSCDLEKEDQEEGEKLMMPNGFNAADRKRAARIMLAYGVRSLPDRQVPVVGVIIGTTEGNLYDHVMNYYTGDQLRRMKSLLWEASYYYLSGI